MYKQSTLSLPIHPAHLLLLALFFPLPLTYLSQKAMSEWEAPWGLPQEWQEPIMNCVSAISFLVFSMDLLHCIHLTVFVWLPFSNLLKELHIMGIPVACRKLWKSFWRALFTCEFAAYGPCFLGSLIASLGQSLYFLKDAFPQDSLLDIVASKAGSILFECLSFRYRSHKWVAFSLLTGSW